MTQTAIINTQNLPDFWSRRANAPTDSFEFTPFGIPVQLSTNRPDILASARLSAGRFSHIEPTTAQPVQIRIIVGDSSTEPVPADLPDRLVYAGLDDWITVAAGEWGHAFANLPRREAVIFLSPALAAEERPVSRYFIDHYLLNFILTEWAMLHASCLLDPARKQLVVMVAPHNTGKSTTALHFLRAGYHFLADGMALIRKEGDGFIVGGYPIGEVKLRTDVLALFPEYTGQPVRVREHRKTIINLRVFHPEQIVEGPVRPSAIHLCFVGRSSTAHTTLKLASADEVGPLLTANTVYWDKPARLAHHTAILAALLRVASVYKLEIGTNPRNIIATLERIM